MFLLQRIFFILSHTLSNTPTHSLSFSNTCHALKLSQVYTLYLYLSISLTQNTICLSQLYTNKQFQNTISCVLPRYLPTYTYLSSNSFSHSLSFSLYHETQTLFLSLSLSLSLSLFKFFTQSNSSWNVKRKKERKKRYQVDQKLFQKPEKTKGNKFPHFWSRLFRETAKDFRLRNHLNSSLKIIGWNWIENLWRRQLNSFVWIAIR